MLVDHLGILLGVQAGQLDLDPVVAHREDQGLGHAEGIDAGADDLDRLFQFLLPGRVLLRGRRLGIHFQRDGDAAGQVEAKLELPLGPAISSSLRRMSLRLSTFFSVSSRRTSGKYWVMSIRRSWAICFRATNSLEAWPAATRAEASSTSLPNSAGLAVTWARA